MVGVGLGLHPYLDATMACLLARNDEQPDPWKVLPDPPLTPLSRVKHEVRFACGYIFLFSSSTQVVYSRRSSGHRVATGVVLSPPRYLPRLCYAHGAALSLPVGFHRMQLDYTRG